jgi:type II secretory pathway component GspD/PulD (secretin)
MNQLKSPARLFSSLLTLLLLITAAPRCNSALAAAPYPPRLAQEEPPPPDEEFPPEPPDAEPLPPDEPAPVPFPDDQEAEPSPEPPADDPPPSRTQPPASTPPPAIARPTPALARTTPALVAADDERNLQLNFRGAPLELVLDYLSDAAGFIIDLQTEVKGQVDVWSNQPLNRAEAVEVLNSVLNRNGYAAVRNGRTLTIVTRENARKMNIPVISGGDPNDIPNTEEMVTQIIPVRFINATQLTKDLEPLMPAQASMTANEGGNALVITDTQANIRRMAEIVRALDTAISATSAVRVFPLQYADAKALATVVTELFQSSQAGTQGGGNPMQQFFRGQGGPFGQQRGNQQASTASGRVATPRVIATADERSNSLVVSAPEDHMPVIEDLVREVDTDIEEITEVRVFRLQYADAQETADLLTQLFPDETSNQNNRGRVQLGGPQAAAATPSARMQQQTRVTAVPDLRTGSVVVSAARNIMTQIAQMIEVLDADPARQQKVFVFDVENTDPQVVQEVLQSLFPSQNTGTGTGTRSTTRQAGSQLNTRASQMQNQGLNTTSGFGTTGTGTRTGTGR